MSQVLDFDDNEIDNTDDETTGFDEEHEMDMGDLLSQFLMEPKKQRNVCEVLVDIKKQLEIQNKILAQFYTTYSKS